jgi:hypothetical protein
VTDSETNKIGKFLMRKKRKKELYKIGKKKHFYMYELVMKADYTADSLLAAVYKGPFRIIHLDEGGARLRDIKSGEEQSVSFENIRKINVDELLTLLPQNFDSEISAVLDKYRYKRGSTNEEGKTEGEKEEPDSGRDSNRRMLRSGRLYNMKIECLGEKTRTVADTVYWRKERILRRERIIEGRPIIVNHSASEREIIYGRERGSQKPVVTEENEESFKEMSDIRERNRFEKNKTSSFSSDTEGTMIIRMRKMGDERPGSRVKFKEILVHFF